MKTKLLVTIVIFFTVVLSSCNRDWVCTCTYPGAAYQSIIQLQISRTTQSDAQAQCNRDAILQDSFTYRQTMGAAVGAWACSL